MPAGHPHNSLLISLANAMGVTDLGGFGNPKHNAKGPIPGFAA